MNVKRTRIVAIIIFLLLALFGGYYYWGTYSQRTSTTSDIGVAGGLPPQIDPKTIGKVVKDAATGKDFISNQIIVEFNTDVTEETALAVIASVGGKMEQRFTAVPLFLVRVDDSGDGSVARTAVKKLEADPRVKRADLNFLTTKPVDNGAAQ